MISLPWKNGLLKKSRSCLQKYIPRKQNLRGAGRNKGKFSGEKSQKVLPTLPAHTRQGLYSTDSNINELQTSKRKRLRKPDDSYSFKGLPLNLKAYYQQRKKKFFFNFLCFNRTGREMRDGELPSADSLPTCLFTAWAQLGREPGTQGGSLKWQEPNHRGLLHCLLGFARVRTSVRIQSWESNLCPDVRQRWLNAHANTSILRMRLVRCLPHCLLM